MHVNPLHRESWRSYLQDLAACVEQVRGARAVGKAAGLTY
jgi:hypothetical protein